VLGRISLFTANTSSTSHSWLLYPRTESKTITMREICIFRSSEAELRKEAIA
jgi:hypothetical protein